MHIIPTVAFGVSSPSRSWEGKKILSTGAPAVIMPRPTRRWSSKRWLSGAWLSLMILILCFFVVFLRMLQTKWSYLAQALYYLSRNGHLRQIWDIHETNAVFFIETNPGVGFISPRVLCAIESAARYNPNRSIIYLNEARDLPLFQHRPILDRYPNVRILGRNFTDLIAHSPVEGIYLHHLVGTPYANENLSDIMRLLVLLAFGGIYLDTDVISLRLAPLESNFAIAFRENYVNFAMGGFTPSHPFLIQALLSMADDFRPWEWAFNGPDLITRVLEDYCSSVGGSAQEGLDIDGLWQWDCPGIRIFPPSMAYPVDFEDWRMLFDPQAKDHIGAKIADSCALHYWNAMIHHGEITLLEANQPLYRVFENHCPMTEAIHLRPLQHQPFHKYN